MGGGQRMHVARRAERSSVVWMEAAGGSRWSCGDPPLKCPERKVRSACDVRESLEDGAEAVTVIGGRSTQLACVRHKERSQMNRFPRPQ